MSQVAIEKVTDDSPKTLPIFGEIAKQFEAIEQRAFDLFEKRGHEPGHDLEDWIQAEQDVVLSPTTELVDEGKEFTVRVALPGFEASDIHLSAMRDALIVQADIAHTHKERSDKVCFCEFSEKKLFRRLALPASIDVDRVSASLDKGILQVTAPKVTSNQTVAVQAKNATANA